MLRQTYNVPPTQHVEVEIHAANESAVATLTTFKGFMEKIARINAKLVHRRLDALDKGLQSAKHGSARAIVSSELEIVMPLGGLIDPRAEKTRIAKDIEKAQKEIGALEKKLGNADFVAKAPEEVVAEQQARLTEEKSKVERLIEALQTVESAQ
jgi:valyl-tRNA synthetase